MFINFFGFSSGVSSEQKLTASLYLQVKTSAVRKFNPLFDADDVDKDALSFPVENERGMTIMAMI